MHARARRRHARAGLVGAGPGGYDRDVVRFDPSQSVDDVRAALRRAAAAAWGDDAVHELDGAIETAAQALWRLSQEPLEPADPEP